MYSRTENRYTYRSLEIRSWLGVPRGVKVLAAMNACWLIVVKVHPNMPIVTRVQQFRKSGQIRHDDLSYGIYGILILCCRCHVGQKVAKGDVMEVGVIPVIQMENHLHYAIEIAYPNNWKLSNGIFMITTLWVIFLKQVRYMNQKMAW